jgi:hypothetical protein
VKSFSFTAALSSLNLVQRLRRKNSLSSFHPNLESLSERTLPSAGSISGYVYQDVTGNGLSAGDVAMSGVYVELYRYENLGFFGSGYMLDGLQKSASNGSYSFGSLPAGQYAVTESAPWGDVQTAPSSFDYAVNLASGQQITGESFANFEVPNTSTVKSISFTVTKPNGTSTTVHDLRGNTQQGDTVTANFTIAPHSAPVTLSLVSYNTTGPNNNPAKEAQDTVLEVATATFGPGQSSLSVQLPSNFYEVDFVVGAAINEFGPAGSNINYSAQGRLLSSDNGGKNALQLGTASGTVTDSVSGNPLAGATVTVTNLVNGAVSTATTNANGSYSIPGLQAGLKYSVSVADSGYTSQSTNVTLAAGTNTENFQLVSNSTGTLANLSGIVSDSNGPVVGAQVNLMDANGDFFSYVTVTGGSYTFTGLQPGTYSVFVAGPNDGIESYSGTITLVAGNNSDNFVIS